MTENRKKWFGSRKTCLARGSDPGRSRAGMIPLIGGQAISVTENPIKELGGKLKIGHRKSGDGHKNRIPD